MLALPYLAGALAGLMTVRIAPTPSLEAAPLWGLLTGALTAVVIGLAAHFSGGALGAGRLSSVGPTSGETGLVAVLEVGVTAALAAGAANWLIIRRHVRRLAAAAAGRSPASASVRPQRAAGAGRVSGPLPALIVDETDDAGGHRIHVNPWADETSRPSDAGSPASLTPPRAPIRCRSRSRAGSGRPAAGDVVAPSMQLAYASICGPKTGSRSARCR